MAFEVLEGIVAVLDGMVTSPKATLATLAVGGALAYGYVQLSPMYNAHRASSRAQALYNSPTTFSYNDGHSGHEGRAVATRRDNALTVEVFPGEGYIAKIADIMLQSPQKSTGFVDLGHDGTPDTIEQYLTKNGVRSTESSTPFAALPKEKQQANTEAYQKLLSIGYDSLK
jgi:hypothetical protein